MKGKVLPEVCNKQGSAYKRLEIEWAKPKKNATNSGGWGSDHWGSDQWGSDAWGSNDWGWDPGWRDHVPVSALAPDPVVESGMSLDPFVQSFHAPTQVVTPPPQPVLKPTPPKAAPPPWRLAQAQQRNPTLKRVGLQPQDLQQVETDNTTFS